MRGLEYLNYNEFEDENPKSKKLKKEFKKKDKLKKFKDEDTFVKTRKK